MSWQLSLELENDALQHSNPLPLLVQCVTELQGLQNQRKGIYTVMAELFSNALEHGLLDLDSALKADPGGFEKYYELRTSRLEAMTEGKIRLSLAHDGDQSRRVLSVNVSHNGSGFDPDTVPVEDESLNTGLCGRGIPMVARLCDSLSYEDGGRSAKAILSLEQDA